MNYNNQSSISEFWNFLVNAGERAIYDSENYCYNFQSFMYKVSKVDEHFLGFLWSAMFVAAEEETIDSSKSYNKLSDNVIDKFVHNKTEIFPKLYPYNTLKIKGPDYILKDDEHNGRWLLSCIKKNLAHGNFSIDDKRGCFIIKNTESPNEIECEVGVYWLAQIGINIQYDRRNTSNQNSLTFFEPYFWNEMIAPVRNEDDLINYLNSTVIYSPTVMVDGTPEEQIQAKEELTSFWNEVRINHNIEEQIPTMIHKVPNGILLVVSVKRKFFLEHLLHELNTTRNFYNMDQLSQQAILEQVIYDFNTIDIHTNVVDYGLHLLSQQVSLEEYVQYRKYQQNQGEIENNDLIRTFGNRFFTTGNFYKEIGLLYLYGLYLFAGNKEHIYDQYVDYDSFDLSDVIAYDYVEGKEKKKLIDRLETEIDELTLESQNKKVQNKLQTKQVKLSKLKELMLDDNQPAITPSNKEFFHRVRNAISHRQIYLVYDAQGVPTDKIVLVDEDKFLTYIEPKKLISLITDKRFFDAIRKYEQNTPINGNNKTK